MLLLLQYLAIMKGRRIKISVVLVVVNNLDQLGWGSRVNPLQVNMKVDQQL